MKVTRRQFLLLLVVLLAGDYGRSIFMMRQGQPPGWKTERWQAGFGSWGQGGYGVAYDISMPPDYDFQQKCGRAWINDNTEISDFSAQLAFRPDPMDRRNDFDLYIKDDPGRDFEAPHSPLKMGAATNFRVGPLQFSRLDFTMDYMKTPDDPAGSPRSPQAVRGFWLSGDQLSVIADLRDRDGAATSERIVRTIRRANGYGLIELFAGTIPGLMGC